MCTPGFANIPGTSVKTFCVKRPDKIVMNYAYISTLDNKNLKIEPLSPINKKTLSKNFESPLLSEKRMVAIYVLDNKVFFYFSAQHENDMTGKSSFEINGKQVRIEPKKQTDTDFMKGIHTGYKGYRNLLQKYSAFKNQKTSV